jgi:hypothetical protein
LRRGSADQHPPRLLERCAHDGCPRQRQFLRDPGRVARPCLGAPHSCPAAEETSGGHSANAVPRLRAESDNTAFSFTRIRPSLERGRLGAMYRSAPLYLPPPPQRLNPQFDRQVLCAEGSLRLVVAGRVEILLPDLLRLSWPTYPTLGLVGEAVFFNRAWPVSAWSARMRQPRLPSARAAAASLDGNSTVAVTIRGGGASTALKPIAAESATQAPLRNFPQERLCGDHPGVLLRDSEEHRSVTAATTAGPHDNSGRSETEAGEMAFFALVWGHVVPGLERAPAA